MGTLTDITAKANNAIKRQSGETSQAVKSPASSENIGKSKSPHFMSPTISSSKQSVPTSKKASDHTPTSSPSAPGEGNGWMASAAKRVGINRTSDGTPRSRKEGLLKTPKTSTALTFPDKLATPAYVQLSDSPSLSPSQAPNINLADKPLPSPPIAQVVKASPTKEARCLIDASEKPLRRSPPGMPHRQEEWPVLFPEKPTTPDTLRQMTHQDSSGGSSKATYHQGERYPILPGTTYDPMSKPEESMRKASSVPKILRKEVSSTNPQIAPNTIVHTNNMEVPTGNRDHEAEKRDAAPGLSTQQSILGTHLPDRSAGAAAIERSAEESKPINQSRQTRTSSLRARLSAGQLINDPSGKSKTLGFTDFTNMKEPLAGAGEDNLHAPKGSYHRAAGSNSRAHTSKPYKDSLHGNRPPAQFVAGSRRPTHRRPSSRGSLRNESRALSPLFAPQPPINSALEIPNAAQEMPVEAIIDNQKSETIEPRRSSIPVFRHAIPNPTIHAEDVHGLEFKETTFTQPKVSREEFSIYEDKSGHHSTALQAINESPRQNYQTKRLSMTSPEHGPTLRISPSAERLIMGTGSDKENQPKFSKYKSRDFRRAAVSNGLENTKDKGLSTRFKTLVQRPLSSQGLPLSASRRSLVNAESREKKARSTDVSSLLPNSMTPTPNSSLKNTGSSSADDPFFNASESLVEGVTNAGPTETNETQKHNDKHGKAVEDESWISPMPNRKSATALSDEVPVHPNHLPTTIKEHLAKEVNEKDWMTQTNDRFSNVSGDYFEPNKNVNAMSGLPATPDRTGRITGSLNSGSFPPRSSSHAAHPDHTINGSAKNSPLSPLGRMSKVSDVDSATGKKYDIHQNNPSSDQALPSYQVEITSGASLPSKRASTARDSNKSQASVSKGMLSNFRGLFAKRSSDPTDPRSTKTSKPPRVTSASSPFSPLSAAHTHSRPTASSLNRTKATPTIASNHTPPTPTLASPPASELSCTTTLAMQILDCARTTRSGPQQRRLIELGSVMVDAVTRARDAEKAMEEARQAARRAEVAYAMCKESLADVTRLVEGWRGGVV